MTNEEIVEKIQEETDPDRYMLMLWEQNEAYICYIIKKTFGTQINEEDYADLKQEGFIALMKAAHGFFPDNGAGFSTFAYKVIQNHLTRYADTCCHRSLRLPSYMEKRILEYNKMVREYTKEHGKRPPDELIMSTMGLTEKSYKSLLKTVHQMNVKSLDEEISPEYDSKTLADYIDAGIDLADLVCKPIWLEELHRALDKALGILDCKAQKAIRARYYDNMSYEAISILLGYASGQTVRNTVLQSFWKICQSKYAEDLKLFMWEGYQPRRDRYIPPYDEDIGSGWDEEEE